MDHDDGVTDFLERVKELGDKRDREDEERARKLEEEILAGRQARKARRDGRSRFVSGTTSHTNAKCIDSLIKP